MAKQNAANNLLLAYVKKQYNAKIYASTLKLVNSGGEAAAIDHLLTFTRQDLRDGERAQLWNIATGTPAKTTEFTFKLARGSEDGEDFQDVFVNGKLVGKLTWWTGAAAGWYFEGQDEQPRYVCPLESGLDGEGEMIIITLEEVLKLATEWLRKQGVV